MTKRTDIGYIEVTKRDDFLREWAKLTTWSTGGTGAGRQQKSEGTEGAKPAEAVAKRKNDGEKGPPAKRTKGVASPPAPSPSQAKKGNKGPKAGDKNDFKSLLKQALETKKKHNEAVVRAANLQSTISKVPAWAWAKARTGPLEKALSVLESKLQPFGQMFMCMDASQMKNQFTHEQMLDGLKNIPQLDTLVDNVAVETKKLHSHHAVELNYSPRG